MAIAIEPIDNRVIYLRIENKEKGSVNMGIDQNAAILGEVVFVGPECKQIKIGDIIFHTSVAEPIVLSRFQYSLKDSLGDDHLEYIKEDYITGKVILK